MSKNAKRSLILVGTALAVGVACFWWRPPTDVQTDNSVTTSSTTSRQLSSAATSVPASADSTKPSASSSSEVVAETAYLAKTESVDADPQQALRSVADSGVRDHLEAEAQLLGPQIELPDGTFATSMDVKAGRTIIEGEGFDRYMDALARQAANNQPATDLTDLYFSEFEEAAKSVHGVMVQRVVCGLRTCLAAATAASSQAIHPWLKSVSERPVHPYALGLYPHQMSDGTFQFRMSFSTDPSIKAAYGRPGK